MRSVIVAVVLAKEGLKSLRHIIVQSKGNTSSPLNASTFQQSGFFVSPNVDAAAEGVHFYLISDLTSDH